ncbi:hypothetical protein [Spirosoma gilvum]
MQGISFESGLDVINRLVSRGDQLVNVRYMDEDGVIELPAVVFDGTSFADSFKALEQEWQQLLVSTPETLPFGSADVAEQAQPEEKLLKRKLDQISHLRSCHRRMLRLMDRAQKRMREGPQKDQLLNHYQQILKHINDSLNRLIRQ